MNVTFTSILLIAMNNILKYMIGGGSVAVLLLSIIFVATPVASAAENTCQTAKFFTMPGCIPCAKVKKDAAKDISTLEGKKRLVTCDYLDFLDADANRNDPSSKEFFKTCGLGQAERDKTPKKGNQWTMPQLYVYSPGPAPQRTPVFVEVISDPQKIILKLAELAKQEPCKVPTPTPTPTTTTKPKGTPTPTPHPTLAPKPTQTPRPSFYSQLATRGIVTPISEAISDAISWLFSRIGSGFMAIVELITG